MESCCSDQHLISMFNPHSLPFSPAHGLQCLTPLSRTQPLLELLTKCKEIIQTDVTISSRHYCEHGVLYGTRWFLSETVEVMPYWCLLWLTFPARCLLSPPWGWPILPLPGFLDAVLRWSWGNRTSSKVILIFLTEVRKMHMYGFFLFKVNIIMFLIRILFWRTTEIRVRVTFSKVKLLAQRVWAVWMPLSPVAEHPHRWGSARYPSR